MKIHATRNTVAAAVLFTALSGVTGIGNANLEEISIESIRVSYADLNLTRSEGAETLYARLKQAAQQVCGEASRQPLARMGEKRDCEENALEKAVDAIGSSQLSALHQG